MVIRLNGIFKLRWDLMIMVLSLWNSYSIPVDIAFEPEIFEALGNRIINHIVDALFAIDMILNFLTSVVDEATG